MWGGEVFFGVGFLAVPSSRRPVVLSSRGLVGPWSCWRASQPFPAIPSHSQPFSANRAPPSRSL